MLRMRQAVPGDMEAVLQLYDGVINRFQAQTGTTAWRKGVYPAEADFQKAIGAGTLYVGELEGTLAAGMIITQGTDKTYGNPPWRVDAAEPGSGNASGRGGAGPGKGLEGPAAGRAGVQHPRPAAV